MIYYVAHKFENKSENLNKALRATHDLAIHDLQNTYICPLTALLHFGMHEIPKKDEMEQRFDLLCCCEKLIVCSNVTEDVQQEIDMAQKLNMEVIYLD